MADLCARPVSLGPVTDRERRQEIWDDEWYGDDTEGRPAYPWRCPYPLGNCSCPNPETCGHLAALPPFDEQAATGLSVAEVRRRWPRFFGACPDCGGQVIAYASAAHFAMGDW